MKVLTAFWVQVHEAHLATWHGDPIAERTEFNVELWGEGEEYGAALNKLHKAHGCIIRPVIFTALPQTGFRPTAINVTPAGLKCVRLMDESYSNVVQGH